MNNFRNKFASFMYGRYGMDQFSRFTSIVCMVLLVLTLFIHNSAVYFIAILLLIYTYFRVFSRNISKRSKENQRYLNIYYKCQGKLNYLKARIKDGKTHRIFKCPNCNQKIRVPKGKGKISIKCPKCRIEFIKRT
ncbi:hypothetical protein [Lachnospira pectinoschiza]|uniref:Zn-finger containing protein n=1 Tax=Lachnospira pectinoschiza TaxID=28052 RepID=A0A1G9YGH8_9FIRM|nr:hypothetical protein [Lachnospira pectinoschiza]SDN07611.1 hypothetical protein SAMN05216544_1813 [Lachnospira pectinoschiza]